MGKAEAIILGTKPGDLARKIDERVRILKPIKIREVPFFGLTCN